MTWLRAFHAHGGVLFLMSLLYYMFLDQTHLSASAKRIGCVALFGGIGILTGGFLRHAILGEPGAYSIGTFVSLAGAGLLASAIILLVYGLMTMPSSHSHTASGGSATLLISSAPRSIAVAFLREQPAAHETQNQGNNSPATLTRWSPSR